MEGVDNKYISRAIDELAGFLGVREDIPAETVLQPLHKGNAEACIERMANHLGLPIKVNLTSVNVMSSESFESRDLVTTEGDGRGTEGIAAQAFMPSNLPLYGSSEMEGFPVQVKVSGDCQRYADAFVATMAHELSHVLLHSLWHTEKNNEIYTDITAMLLGFGGAMRKGRHAVETTNIGLGWQLTSRTRFGYLKDAQFRFALGRVEAIRRSNRSAFNTMRTAMDEKLGDYRKQLASYRKLFKEFNKLIEYLDRKQAKKIRKEDARKIVEIHSLNYGDRFVSVLRSNERKLSEIEALYSGWLDQPQDHYSEHKLKSLEVFHDDLASLLQGLKHESAVLKDDVRVMRRCFGFLERLQIK